jgi:hypothetical protein
MAASTVAQAATSVPRGVRRRRAASADGFERASARATKLEMARATTPTGADDGEARAGRLGRRIALVSYFSFVAVVCVAGGAPIIWQVLEAPTPTIAPPATCSESLDALARAVSRARSEASSADGEDAALSAFRAALEPEWTTVALVERQCASSAEASAFDLTVRLRYAEEHAVRRESHELAPIRRKMKALGR